MFVALLIIGLSAILAFFILLIVSKNKPTTIKKRNDNIGYVLLAIGALSILGGKFIGNPDIAAQDNIETTRSIPVTSTPTSTTCSVCGRAFFGDGYEEVAEGVWRPTRAGYSTQICSKECGLKHTKQINGLINETNSNNGSLCANCGLGHYDNGFCTKCGAASPQRVNESRDKMPNCELCNGSGYEESSMGNGRRICPACNGTGKVSY